MNAEGEPGSGALFVADLTEVLAERLAERVSSASLTREEAAAVAGKLEEVLGHIARTIGSPSMEDALPFEDRIRLANAVPAIEHARQVIGPAGPTNQSGAARTDWPRAGSWTGIHGPSRHQTTRQPRRARRGRHNLTPQAGPAARCSMTALPSADRGRNRRCHQSGLCGPDREPRCFQATDQAIRPGRPAPPLIPGRR